MILIYTIMGISIMFKIILVGIVSVGTMGTFEATEAAQRGGGEAPTKRVPF